MMQLDVSPLTILATIALGLMVVVTGGVAYLTAADWRDRRREAREAREKSKRGS
ncbi:MAG: hypothetical protein AAFY26_19825 [Cyanobacteria bacterium J06638_22]